MSRAKKPKFDPSSQRANFKTRRTLLDGVLEMAHTFLQSVREALACNQLKEILSSLDLQTQELVLVASLGLEGVDSLRLASQLVPKEYPQRDRVGYVAAILNAVLSTPVENDVVVVMMNAVERLPFYDHHAAPQSYMSVLRFISQATGVAHTQHSWHHPSPTVSMSTVRSTDQLTP